MQPSTRCPFNSFCAQWQWHQGAKPRYANETHTHTLTHTCHLWHVTVWRQQQQPRNYFAFCECTRHARARRARITHYAYATCAQKKNTNKLKMLLLIGRLKVTHKYTHTQRECLLPNVCVCVRVCVSH